MALFFAVILAAGGLAALVNAVAKRPVLNGGRIGAVVVLILMLIRFSSNVSDPDVGRRLGGIIGQAFLPLLLAVWIDRRQAKKTTPGGPSKPV